MEKVSNSPLNKTSKQLNKAKRCWANEIVLVTGGAGGIGSCIIASLEEEGTTIVVLDVQPMVVKGGNTHFYRCDVTSPEMVEEVAAKIRQEVGNPTILINNAGIIRGKTVLDASPDDIALTFGVNALAAFWIVKAFLPAMIEANHGTIVTLSSTASWLALPNTVDYSASKAAAEAFHFGITAELGSRYGADRVRTILVNPGYTKTPLFDGFKQPLSRLLPPLEPSKVARAIVKRISKDRSGRLTLPKTAMALSFSRVFPTCVTSRLAKLGETSMDAFRGRQAMEVRNEVDEAEREQ